MSPGKQRTWSREQFLELLDDEDIAALWKKWQLPPSEKVSKSNNVFLKAVGARSNTSLLQDVLSLRTGTLEMLRDVVMFLLDQKSSVRTTGSVLVLDEEFNISPQQVSAALQWSPATIRKHTAETWENLVRTLRSKVEPLLQIIDDYGRVRVRRDEENIVDVARRVRRGGSPTIRKTRTAVYDSDGLRVRKEYGGKLKDLNRKLRPLCDRQIDNDARVLIRRIDLLHREYETLLQQDLAEIDSAHRERHPSSGERLSARDHEIWTSFVENVLFLSDVEESSSVTDLLRMDLFRKRPQLYEIWIVVVVIRFLRSAGYKMELLSMATTKSDRVVWNLNYAKSQVPIARMFRPADSSEYFLFYQLFRTGESRDEMPDLALMPSRRPNDTPAWIMDPKHSERRGYSRRDYEKVALRYGLTFAPEQTWIVEYYPRPDLGSENPLAFAKNVALIRDVSPNGSGYECLIRELREFHGSVAKMVAVVDVSDSFKTHLPHVKADLIELRTQGAILDDHIIWFADRAAHTSGFIDKLEEENGLVPPADLGGGTRFGPALEQVAALCKDTSVGTSIRIYTDGKFGDVSLNEVTERLKQYGEVKIIDFRS